MKKEKIIVICLVTLTIFISGCLGVHFAYKQNNIKENNNEVKQNMENNTYDVPEANINEEKTDDSKINNSNSNSISNKNTTTQKSNSSTVNKNVVSKEDDSVKVIENDTTKTNDVEEKIDNNAKDINYSNNDQNVISTFENIDKKVDTLLKSGNNESIKDQAKGVFISLVDFIFYDGSINGITFDELTDAGKQKILEITSSIDQKIDDQFPGYKETISTKTKKAFTKASEVIKSGANNINNFAKEKLGDEYYQEIINSKDELAKYTLNAISIIGDVGSNLFSKGKDFLNNWYQNFKK